MAEWTIILKNGSGSLVEIEDLGFNIPDASQSSAHLQFDFGELAGSEDLRTLVGAGTIVVNDGVGDLSATDGVNHLTREHKKDVLAAQTDATQALTDAATADGKAVAAQGTADTAITNAATAQSTAEGKVSKSGDTMTGDLSMGANEVLSTADPVSGNALTRKSWVEAQILAVAAGLDPKESCRVASTANIDLATGGLLTLDDIQTVAGDRVLVKDQTDATENGIYIADSGEWVRSSDMDGTPTSEVSGGANTFVEVGTLASGNAYTLIWDGDIDLGVDDITWAQSGAAGSVGAIQGEVDAIEAAIGSMIDSSGDFVVPTGTNFLNAVSSIANAILALDTAAQTAIDDAATAQSAADSAQSDATQAINDASTAQGTADAAQSDATQALSDAATAQSAAEAAQDDATTNTDALNLMSVSGGMVFGRDDTRGKWMGAVMSFLFGKGGNTKNQYIKIVGDMYSNISGIRMHRAVTITSLSLQLKEAGTCTVEIRKNDSATSIATLVCTASAGAHVDNLNVDLAAGEYLQCYVTASTAVKFPAVNCVTACNGGSTGGSGNPVVDANGDPVVDANGDPVIVP